MRRTFALILLLLLACQIALAHPGNTDSKGGHTNRSTGEYHYHHGYPEHQHNNGECPYATPKPSAKPKPTESSKKSTVSTSKPASNAGLNALEEYARSTTVSKTDEVEPQKRVPVWLNVIGVMFGICLACCLVFCIGYGLYSYVKWFYDNSAIGTIVVVLAAIAIVGIWLLTQSFN